MNYFESLGEHNTINNIITYNNNFVCDYFRRQCLKSAKEDSGNGTGTKAIRNCIDICQGIYSII